MGGYVAYEMQRMAPSRVAGLAQPPQLKIVSSVGSGDAFLGGLLFALENGASSETALQKAVAAGAANTLEFGGGTFSLPSFEEILQNTKISLM